MTQHDESLFSDFEKLLKEVRVASDLCSATARESLIPEMNKDQAKAMRGIPVTRPCGIHLANTLKALMSIAETGKDANFVSVAEHMPRYGSHTIRLWRIPNRGN